MENPFKSWTQKDWLYVGGAVASIVALILFIAYQKRTAIPGGTITDAQNTVVPGAQPLSPVNYVNQNVPDMADVVPIAAGADTSPNTEGTSGCGGCCDKAGNSGGYCTGPSPLSTGNNTYSTVDRLIDYYQNTNPVYVQLQELQLQKYATLFATGESYTRGGIKVGAEGVVT
jgi:hypothetical protein